MSHVHVKPQGSAPPSRKKARLYERAHDPKPMRLEARDIEVLKALASHRFLSGEQLRRLVFDCSGAMVRRRLRALFDHRLLAQIAVVAQPTRGVPPFVYILGKNGVAALADVGITATSGTLDGNSLQNINHRYLVNEVHVTLVEATRGTRYGIAQWWHEDDLKIAGANGLKHAPLVRHRLLSRPTAFLPDAFFELRVSGGESFAFFVEVDLATHSQRTWRERARLYAAYADPTAGLFRQRFGRQTFRVLIVTTPDFRQRSRCQNILDSVRREIGPTDIALGTTFTDLQANRVLGPIWRPADGSNRRLSIVPRGVRVVHRAVGNKAVSARRVIVTP